MALTRPPWPSASVYFFILLVVSAVSIHVDSITVNTSLPDTSSSADFHPSQTPISEFTVPSLPVIFVPTSSAVQNPLCRNHSAFYVESLGNSSLWAIKMFESSAKLPTGFFIGSTFQMGSFDECLSVSVNPTAEGRGVNHRGFSGKYCLANFKIPPQKRPISEDEDSIWKKVKQTVDSPAKMALDNMKWAICMPSSCSASDLQSHLIDVFPKLDSFKALGIPVEDVTIEVDEVFCTSNEDDDELTIGQTVMISVIVALVMMVVIGTTFHRITYYMGMKPEGCFGGFIMCFSILRNFGKLFRDNNKRSPLDHLSGLKFMTMHLIIFGHRLLFTLGGPLLNPVFIEGRYEKYETAMIFGGLTIVDTFYVLSGFLLSYLFLFESHRVKNAWIIFYLYVRRFIRLIPLYMFVVAFYATLLVKFGSGPFWKYRIGFERDRCVENWWTNILFINTFVNADSMCMIQSWYITADMHYFVISVPLVYLLSKKPMIGKTILSIILIGSVAVPFCMVYFHQLDPIFFSYFENVEDVAKYDTFRDVYIPTYMRSTPYFMGLAIGYYLYYIKINEIVISQKWVDTVVISSLVLGLIPMFTASIFYQLDHQYNAWESASYASLQRVSWGLAMCGTIFVCTLEREWVTMKLLSWKAFKPLSKLTYSAFLIHAGLQLGSVASLKSPQNLSIFTLMQLTYADTLLTFLLALLMALFLEAPLLGIEKLLFSDAEKTEDKSLEDQRRRSKEPDDRTVNGCAN